MESRVDVADELLSSMEVASTLGITYMNESSSMSFMSASVGKSMALTRVITAISNATLFQHWRLAALANPTMVFTNFPQDPSIPMTQ